jgi:hypothetical protein
VRLQPLGHPSSPALVKAQGFLQQVAHEARICMATDATFGKPRCGPRFSRFQPPGRLNPGSAVLFICILMFCFPLLTI